jgi:hypothetical protein
MSPLKTAVAAAGMLVASAGIAAADCEVKDYDKKGFFGFGHATYSRTFNGNSAETIWQRYCKPFIQRTVAQKGILNGEFGMHCTGRLRCDIQGRIENGRVQPPSKFQFQ